MINNLELLKPLLKFEEEGDFYMLYILKRKKDQPEGEKDNHQSVRTIKTYCVDNLEYLDKRWDEITHMCEYFKARAYIHVQKQNHKDVGLNMLAELANRIRDGVFKFNNLFDSVVGQLKVYEKLWIVDVDDKDNDILNQIINTINDCDPQFKGVDQKFNKKIVAIIPTKSGYHLITRPFHLQQFRAIWMNVDVQKKNPTLLYLPNSLT